MGLTIARAVPVPASGLVADRRICVTADGRPCEETDAAAAYLLVAPGQAISAADVERLQLRVEGGRIAWGPVVTPPSATEPPTSGAASRDPGPNTTTPDSGRDDASRGETYGGFPDGYRIVSLPGGWYALYDAKGPVLDDAGNEVRARGKARATDHFADFLRGRTNDSDGED